MKQAGTSKFTYPAEMLPNNDRTKVIMKAREEEQAAREATEKAVSATQAPFKPTFIENIIGFSFHHFSYFPLIVERQAAKRGKRAQEEGEC